MLFQTCMTFFLPWKYLSQTSLSLSNDNPNGLHGLQIARLGGIDIK